MITAITHNSLINNPVRQTKGKVELYEGSTLINTFSHTDKLISFSIERVGEGGFFGYGVSQKVNVKLIDKNRELNLTTANSLKCFLNDLIIAPVFKITEVNRDENTNELSITAYDCLADAVEHTVAELGNISGYPYPIASAAATKIGASSVSFVNSSISSLNNTYASLNYEGTETIRELLDDIAEITGTIYYINSNNTLVFKGLDRDGAAVLTIGKDSYYTLDSKTNRRLSKLIATNELENSIEVALEEAGTTQYIRSNAFWELMEDAEVAALLEALFESVKGLTINQFALDWRGNYLLEIGDKIALTTKDNTIVYSYLLDDVITYDGSLSQASQWEYQEEEDTSGNPTTLGEALKDTYAKVNKADKRIDLVVSEVNSTNEALSQLALTTEGISASVSGIETTVEESLEAVEQDISTLKNKVSLAITQEDVNIAITSQLENGVSKVETSTGFTFDENGLSVEKSNSEMKTTITEDGMTVYKNDEAMLVANNTGVEAKNLHATTYLIIGTNSRFEDYGERTGCFWIGGGNG